MNADKLTDILSLITAFSERNSDVLAVGLCGSYARGNARPDSDIDLSIIVKDQLRFKTTDWIEELNFGKISERLDYYLDRAYGRVWSRHIFLKSKIEIEFSFANTSWANVDNLDHGTFKVVSDGYKIIYDPKFILTRLLHKVQNIAD